MLTHETETIETKAAANTKPESLVESDSVLIRLLSIHILESSAKTKLQLQAKAQLQR